MMAETYILSESVVFFVILKLGNPHRENKLKLQGNVSQK
jgi:hypothetical protein